MAQATLLEALNVKVWVSCVYESSPEKGSLDSPLIMPALPLADETSLTPETHNRLESRAPHELAHLVTTWADEEDSGHCWLTLTPAQAMRLRQIQTTLSHDSSVPIKHVSPTPVVQRVQVQTPQHHFTWTLLDTTTPAEIHEALRNLLHPHQTPTATWRLCLISSEPTQATSTLIHHQEEDALAADDSDTLRELWLRAQGIDSTMQLSQLSLQVSSSVALTPVEVIASSLRWSSASSN